MTLRNMRQNGVRTLAVTCGAVWCHHQATLDVNVFADDVVVPSFGPRMVCTVCGAIGADARRRFQRRQRIRMIALSRLPLDHTLDSQTCAASCAVPKA
jgi:hypothetical protein